MKKLQSKKGISMLLVLSMILMLIPATVFAAGNEEIWVNGVDILSAKDYTVACGDGTAVYNPTDRKLTLTNAQITTPATKVTSNFKEEYGIFSIAASIKEQVFTIELIGNNSISLIHDGMSANGIWLPSADLKISGEGSLDISLGFADTSNSSPYGIMANTLDISCQKISTELTLDSESKDFAGTALCGKNGVLLKNVNFVCSSFEWGIDERTGAGIKIDNSVAEITNVAEPIISGSSVDILNKSRVEAHGLYFAVLADTDILISDSNVIGSSTEHECNAIISWGNMTIEAGADVTASSYYPALYADYAITIEDSVIQATSTHDTAVYCYEPMKITNADITANGLSALGAYDGMEITGSQLDIAGELTGIFTWGSLSITNCTDMSVKAGYSPIVADGVVTIDNCTGTIESFGVPQDPSDPDSSRIYSTAVSSGGLTVSGNSTDLVISGASGIDCYGDMVFNSGKISAVGTNGGGIDIEGVLDFRGGELHAKGTTNAICARVYSEQTDLTTPPIDNPILMMIAENHVEISGAKIAGTGWKLASIYDSGTDETIQKWRYTTSFVSASDETGILQDNYSNAVKDVTLKIEGADYSAVDKVIEKANALNKDEYKDFSGVEAAVSAVNRDKNITEQADVDAYATAIENAIAALEYKGADYSAVDKAIEKANALNKDEYKDFSGVEAAVSAVIRDKNVTEQADVNAYATAIENAITALEYKGADYSAVDKAIEKANALNKDEYKDFSGVEAAVSAVIRDKNITEQADVDAMAEAINDAISALEKKSDTKPGAIDNPETGDNSMLELWITLLFVSGAGAIAVGTTIYSRKRKQAR